MDRAGLALSFGREIVQKDALQAENDHCRFSTMTTDRRSRRGATRRTEEHQAPGTERGRISTWKQDLRIEQSLLYKMARFLFIKTLPASRTTAGKSRSDGRPATGTRVPELHLGSCSERRTVHVRARNQKQKIELTELYKMAWFSGEEVQVWATSATEKFPTTTINR